MRRLVIIDQDGNSIKNDIFEKLFDIRESEIERKIEINEKRQYKNVNGVNTRIED